MVLAHITITMSINSEKLVKDIGNNLFSLNRSLSVNDDFKRDTSDYSLMLYNLIESLKESISLVNTENSMSNVDRSYIEKITNMYEDSKFKPDPLSDSQHMMDSLNDKIGSDTVILKQIKTIDDRNIDAALKSLELTFAKSGNTLTQHIESGAEVIETGIPKLQSQIVQSRRDFRNSHDSDHLLNSAVHTNYCVLRDGFVELLRDHHSESVAQLRINSGLESKTAKWFESEMQAILAAPLDKSGAMRDRSERVFEETQALYSKACDATFEHLLKNNDFEGSEREFELLQTVRCSVSKWKASIARHSEDILSRALAVDSDLFMSLVEELQQRLAVLQVVSSRVFFYDRTLGKQIALLRQMESHEQRSRSRLAGKLSVARHEHFHSVHNGENALSMDRNVRRTKEIEDHSLRLGTSLHAKCVALQMSPEQTEAALLEMLPSYR